MEEGLVGSVNSISTSSCSEDWLASAWRVAAARLAAPRCWRSACFWLLRLPRLCFGFGFAAGRWLPLAEWLLAPARQSVQVLLVQSVVDQFLSDVLDLFQPDVHH